MDRYEETHATWDSLAYLYQDKFMELEKRIIDLESKL